jgi:hypothetical protein
MLFRSDEVWPWFYSYKNWPWSSQVKVSQRPTHLVVSHGSVQARRTSQLSPEWNHGQPHLSGSMALFGGQLGKMDHGGAYLKVSTASSPPVALTTVEPWPAYYWSMLLTKVPDP